VKALVAEQRGRPRAPLPPLPAGAVPIVVRDRGPFVHYPASPEDLRAVLARLPAGVVNGVAQIELLLEEDPEERAEGDVDPFVGRLTREKGAGIYASSTLGCYWSDNRVIQLFAYVYDPARQDRGIVDFYLRLKMLTTFVHELAHHEDYATRGGKRQWRKHDRDTREEYARELEHAWTQDHVVPYLLEAYPSEARAFSRWLEVHGGAPVALGVIAGDPRSRWLMDCDLAFEELLEAVMKGKRAPETCIGFAVDLRLCDHPEEGLEILDRVLVEHPGHRRAIIERGQILVCLGRLDEASALATQLARECEKPMDENDLDALELVRDIARARSDWRGVVDASKRVVAACKRVPDASAPIPEVREWSSREAGALALFELGEIEHAERLIAWLRNWEWAKARRANQLAVLEHMALLRRGAYAEALEGVTKLLASGATLPIAEAIRSEAAHATGRPEEIGDLCSWTRERLLRLGYAAWLARLDALVS
jgi:hypothetical protein